MIIRRISLMALIIMLVIGSDCVNAQSRAATVPRVFLLNGQLLQQNKRRLSNLGDAGDLRPALARLERDAQKALGIPLLSITEKTVLPQSGDKHDYLSQAPYWWPNPETPNGLPYVRRDGETNPEIKSIPDHALMDTMIKAVTTLAAAFYFTGKEVYAVKAAAILRGWFLDPHTKMNPHLEYAQGIPGINKGRGIGIIETRQLPQLVDAIGLLRDSRSWTNDDQTGLVTWFAKYLKWLTDSANGRDESDAKNNHGTYYDVQVVAFALFTRNPAQAKRVLESAKAERIAKQIEPDGRQPLELARTRSWGYSNMNLEGMIAMAELAVNVGVDLWNFRTADGRSIRRAIEFLHPYAVDPKKWTFRQIEAMDLERLYSSMRRAGRRFNDAEYRRMMTKVPAARPDDGNRLWGS